MRFLYVAASGQRNGASHRCKKKISVLRCRIHRNKTPVGHGKQPPCRKLERRNDRQGHKAQGHEWCYITRNPVVVQQGMDGIQRAHHCLGRFGGHEASHWQGQFVQNPATARNGNASAHGSHAAYCCQHVCVVVAADHNIVRIVAYRRGHGSAAQAVARQNAHAYLACGLVALKNRQFAQAGIAARIK